MLRGEHPAEWGGAQSQTLNPTYSGFIILVCNLVQATLQLEPG